MTDPDPGQGENGNAPDKKGDETPPVSKIKNKLHDVKQLFSKDLEHVGLFVFSITAVATILFIAGFNFFPLEGTSPYSHLRSTELLLTLAATGLVVAIIGRGQHPLVLAFGIFLIGALIVPSKDIVRFALIATGSDRSYESFFRSARSGTDLTGRSTDVANKIITELTHADFMETLDPVRRKQALRIVDGEVRKEREITLLEQVRTRGAMETLRATRTDIEGWVYKYGKEEKFNEDIRYLRSEGLISYAYSDLVTVTITSLGRALLERDSEFAGAAVPAGLPGGEPAAYQIPIDQFACPPDIIDITDASIDLRSAEGRPMRLGRNSTYMRFVVSEAGNYQIDVEVINQDTNRLVDPQLALFHLTDANVCTLLATDDDGGTFLDSSLSLQLEPQTYMIGMNSIRFTGNVTVRVRKSMPMAN